uniref:Zgc: n=1 Tax=Steinernema glaseri TaxID=37863 RepID=A0A1I8A1L3_9BILA
MDLRSDTKKKWSFDELSTVSLILILILAAIVSFIASYTYQSHMTYEDTSKPCDTNAFLDKAFSFHERYLSYFNFELRQWVRENDIPRDTASERLDNLMKDAEAVQMKLSEGENYEQLKELAIVQVLLTQKQDKSPDDTISAIERYIKAVNMDRTFVLEKFLVDYIYHPKKTTVAALKEALLQIDQKVDELKKQLHAEYHEPIDTFWSDLKRNITPGILESCLPGEANVEAIVEEYRTMVEQRVSSCAPEGKEKFVFTNSDLLPCTLLIFLMFSLILVCICYFAGIIHHLIIQKSCQKS